MTKVTIDPGPCGFKAVVTAEMNDDELVDVKVACGCKAVMDMMAKLGTEFDPMEVCLLKPGLGPFYETAQELFPIHNSCPVIPGIVKCIEVEANLALKHDVTITFD